MNFRSEINGPASESTGERARNSLLTLEEERYLGWRVINDGDQQARNELVERNLGLVFEIARSYQGRGFSFEDLVQYGNVGLIKSANSYDPAQGFRFSTYATTAIKKAISRAIEDFSREIRIPVSARSLYKKVIEPHVRDCQIEDKDTEFIELAINNKGRSDSRKLMKTAERYSYIDRAFRAKKQIIVGRDEENNLDGLHGKNETSLPANEQKRYEIGLLESTLEEAIKEGEITERDAAIFREYHCLYGQSCKTTYQKLGDKYGITRERVRQIIGQVMDIL